MRNKLTFPAIAFLVIVFLLSIPINAQSMEKLGPSCNSQHKKLPVNGFKQEQGSWCWVATAQSVMDFHGKKAEQCALVETVIPGLACCGSNATPDCLAQAGYPEMVFDVSEFSYWPQDFQGALNWTTATEEICQNRPFNAEINFSEGDNHYVVVLGYTAEPTDGKPSLWIFDPADGEYSFATLDDFFNQNPQRSYIHVRDTYEIRRVEK